MRHVRSSRFPPAMLKFDFLGDQHVSLFGLVVENVFNHFRKINKKNFGPFVFLFFPFEQSEKGASTFSVMTFHIMTHSIKELIVTLSIKGIQHNDTQKE